jgi:hypothetical protein
MRWPTIYLSEFAVEQAPLAVINLLLARISQADELEYVRKSWEQMQSKGSRCEAEMAVNPCG